MNNGVISSRIIETILLYGRRHFLQVLLYQAIESPQITSLSVLQYLVISTVLGVDGHEVRQWSLTDHVVMAPFHKVHLITMTVMSLYSIIGGRYELRWLSGIESRVQAQQPRPLLFKQVNIALRLSQRSDRVLKHSPITIDVEFSVHYVMPIEIQSNPLFRTHGDQRTSSIYSGHQKASVSHHECCVNNLLYNKIRYMAV